MSDNKAPPKTVGAAQIYPDYWPFETKECFLAYHKALQTPDSVFELTDDEAVKVEAFRLAMDAAKVVLPFSDQ